MYKVSFNILTIGMDINFIVHSVNVLKNSIKNSNIEEDEVSTKLSNIIKAMVLIMDLDDNLFSLIPLTKSGIFSRNSSVLIYDTGIKGLTSNKGHLQLRLITNANTYSCSNAPIFCLNQLIKPVDVPLTKFDGNYGQIVLTYKSKLNKNEEPIITDKLEIKGLCD